MSRGRRDRAVLSRGDAADEVETFFEGLETLIAVGIQAGKVLVYNLLGLLIHEIVMDRPVLAVEWVGDMTAPSVLLARESPLSPQPGAVIKKLREEIGEAEEKSLQSTKPNKDLKETIWTSRVPVVDKKPSVSFSTPTRNHSSLPLLSNSLQSPPGKLHPEVQPFKLEPPSLRSSETMMSGALPVPSQPSRRIDFVAGPRTIEASTVRVRRQPRVKKTPTAPQLRSWRVSASKSSCCSLRRSASSSQEFFTPSSTQFPSVCKAESRNEVAQHTGEPHPTVREKRHKTLQISSGDSSSSPEYEQGNGKKPVTRATGRTDYAKAKLSRPAAAAMNLPVLSASSSVNAPSSLRSISRSYDLITASGPMLNQLAFQGNVAKQ